MTRTFKIVSIALLAFLMIGAVASADDARKEKILANLKLQFPQLDNATLGELKASPYQGLDEGTFAIPGRPPQAFFVASDDSKLYILGPTVDVSKGADEIAAEVKKREEAEMAKAMETRKELDEAIAGLPVRGNPDAPVTIVEFSDFQCPYCSRGADTMEQVLEKYPNDVKFVFMHFPLNFHQWAKPAAIASHCAAAQNHDAFWTLHDKYFEDQKELTPDNIIAKSKEYLAGSGVDMDKWSNCAEKTDSEEYLSASATVDQNMALGQKYGVTGTPGFFVNGTFLNGAQPLTAFEPLIEKAKSAGP